MLLPVKCNIITLKLYFSKVSDFSVGVGGNTAIFILTNTEYLIQWICRKYCSHKLVNWSIVLCPLNRVD